MEIKDTIITRTLGIPIPVVYKDVDNEKDLEGIPIEGARAYCFYQDKLVIVHESKGHWNLPGGGIDDGEDVRDGICREIKEETNMKVIKMRFVGLQEIHEPEAVRHIIRAVCLVEPDGEFASDPAGEVTEIKFVDPEEAIRLTDAHWGQIGQRMMQRAIELKGLIQVEIDYIK